MGRRGHPGGPYGVDADDEDRFALSPKQAFLTADVRVHNAALIAHTFRLDPVLLLEERDPLKRLLRLVAHNIVQQEASKAARGSQPG